MARLLLLLSACFTLCVCHQCPEGWTLHADKCYAYIDLRLAWIDAISTCKTLGGHLVEVTSASENHFVSRLINKSGVDWTWLGFNDLVKEGRWVSAITNQTIAFQSWIQREPNNLLNQDCGQINRDGMWDGIDCHPDIRRTFVCQRMAN